MKTTTTTGARGLILNRTELAEVFAVAPTTVDGWTRRGAPVLKRATGRGSGATAWQFESAAIVEWLREQSVKNAIGDLTKIDTAEARRRKVAAEAALAELELAERRRDLVEVAAVETVWCGLVGNFKARLLVMPSKLAVKVASLSEPPIVRATLEDAIYEALAELSSEGNMQSVMADLEKHPTGDERGNGGGVMAETVGELFVKSGA